MRNALHPVAGLAGALQEEGDPPERGRGRKRRAQLLPSGSPSSLPSSGPLLRLGRALLGLREALLGGVGGLARGPAGPVADRRLALGVDGGEQQPAQQPGVLQEVRELPEALGRVGVLPEAVAGQRGGHDRGRQRERGEPGKPTEPEQGAGDHLDGGVGLHPLLDVPGHRAPAAACRPSSAIFSTTGRAPGHAVLRLAQGADAAVDEGGGEQWPGDPADQHGDLFPSVLRRDVRLCSARKSSGQSLATDRSESAPARPARGVAVTATPRLAPDAVRPGLRQMPCRSASIAAVLRAARPHGGPMRTGAVTAEPAMIARDVERASTVQPPGRGQTATHCTEPASTPRCTARTVFWLPLGGAVWWRRRCSHRAPFLAAVREDGPIEWLAVPRLLHHGASCWPSRASAGPDAVTTCPARSFSASVRLGIFGIARRGDLLRAAPSLGGWSPLADVRWRRPTTRTSQPAQHHVRSRMQRIGNYLQLVLGRGWACVLPMVDAHSRDAPVTRSASSRLLSPPLFAIDVLRPALRLPCGASSSGTPRSMTGGQVRRVAGADRSRSASTSTRW